MKKFQRGSRFEPKDRVLESRNLYKVGIRIRAPRIIRIHQTKTNPKPIDENQGASFRDLLAKAQKKLEEHRHQIDHREAKEDITSQRIASRLALNQMVADINCYDHLDYHSELERFGCKFIHDQVKYLKKFKLMSRSNYFHESNSILKKSEIPWCDE